MSTTRLAIFASILEDDTRAQAERTASMPSVRPHVALMPDAHLDTRGTRRTSSRCCTPCARS